MIDKSAVRSLLTHPQALTQERTHYRRGQTSLGEAISRYKWIGVIGAFIAVAGGGISSWLTVGPLDPQHAAPWWAGWTPIITSVLTNVGASLIGLYILLATIEWKLRNELIQDVVRQALGYFLPDELRVVMQRLYEQNIVCTKCEVTFRLERVDAATVRISVTLERTLCNITSKAVPVPMMIQIDDWMDAAHPPTVLQFTSRLGGETTVDHLGHEVESGHPLRFKIEDAAISLPAKATIEVHHRWHLDKKADDAFLDAFLAPTRNPTFRVECDPTLDYWLEAGSEIPLELHVDKYWLPYTLLPYQTIALRWRAKRPSVSD